MISGGLAGQKYYAYARLQATIWQRFSGRRRTKTCGTCEMKYEVTLLTKKKRCLTARLMRALITWQIEYNYATKAFPSCERLSRSLEVSLITCEPQPSQEVGPRTTVIIYRAFCIFGILSSALLRLELPIYPLVHFALASVWCRHIGRRLISLLTWWDGAVQRPCLRWFQDPSLGQSPHKTATKNLCDRQPLCA